VGRTWRWQVVAALLAALTVGWLQTRVVRGDPITTDENSYLFQARLFAAARIWAPAPAERDLFQFRFSMINMTGERWFSRYPFGQPLALVPGVLIGYPLFVPLMLAIGSVLLVSALARTMFDEPTAGLAALLLALSPFFDAMHATFLSHTTTLFVVGIFMLASLKACESSRAGWGLLAGAALGYAFNTRPFTAVVMSWPFVAWCGWHWLGRRAREGTRQAAAFALTAGSFIAAYLIYSELTTGDWRVSPYALYNPTERPGFAYVGMSGQHTPANGLANTVKNVSSLDRWWLGVPGSLAVLGLMLLRRWQRHEALLVLSAASLAAGYFFFYFPGVGTVGPMYYFEALLPLTLLGARSLVVLWERLPAGSRAGWHGAALRAVALVLWIAALARFWVGEVPRLEEELAPQRAFRAAVANSGASQAIVFIPGVGPEWRAVTLEPFGPHDLLFVRTNRRRDERIIRRNPDRRIYRYEEGRLSEVPRPK
jgi:4-amino-4-deoxy-L-arabinose transferase-like glycosyltransferase